MIELYTWPTPNGHKVHIMLEETGLDYEVYPIDIGAGEQFNADFLRISPNNKMPAIIDREGPEGHPLPLFESGAILIYLAEKTGYLLPKDATGRYRVLQWLMWQMGGLGPMLGQAHHFRQYAPERIQYAYDRYTNEARRLYGVLDRRLAESPYLGGEHYSIADIAAFPWTRNPERQGVEAGDYPNYQRWAERIAARPAVQRGLEVLAERRQSGGFDEKAKEILFGATQYQRR
jgi:GST-like protein